MIPRTKFIKVTEAGIQSLIDDGVREGRTVDSRGRLHSVTSATRMSS